MAADWGSAVFRAEPRPGAVEAARRFSMRMMRFWSLSRVEERVTAIITELVANAVKHARTDLEVRLSHNGEVRIEVTDQDAAPPVLTIPEPLQEGGRGMLIVDHYASSWGYATARRGKTVWAEIELTPVPQAAAGSE